MVLHLAPSCLLSRIQLLHSYKKSSRDLFAKGTLMAPRRLIRDTPRGNGARGSHPFNHSCKNNINEIPYAHRMENSGCYPTTGFLIFSCLSAVMLYSARCLFRNLVVFTHSVWFLSLVLPTFCVCARYLYRVLNRNGYPWFKFRSIHFCFKSCICQLRRSKSFFIRSLACFAQPFTLALSFCHRFSPLVFTDVLSPSLSFLVHLRSSSLLHNFAVSSLSTLTACPAWSPSPSDMFLHNMLRRVLVSEDSVESCFLGLSDAEEGVLLSRTLVGLDSNPEIEKTAKFVLIIYRAIPDLKFASTIQQLGSVLWNSDLPNELSVVFQVVGKEQELDDFESCWLASKLWLEKHTETHQS
ncbi:hypothetical protein F5887DRAFT_597944 [Amanita rubescens]|nr:hypothetical protein F5887DRAFT_597944 [Amanita rubescens]